MVDNFASALQARRVAPSGLLYSQVILLASFYPFVGLTFWKSVKSSVISTAWA